MRRAIQNLRGRSCAVIESLELRQLLSAGALDTSFSGDGITSAPFDTVSVTGNGMAVQSDGKIVEVGSASGGRFVLVRYNTNGTLDTSFGTTGSGKISVHVADSDSSNKALAVAIQADGKIVVVGQTLERINGGDPMIICRFTTAGALDKTFDDDGIVEINRFGGDFGPADFARGNAIAIQKDGKIVIAGDEHQGDINQNDNMVMVRLNTNGSEDTSFGVLGEVVFDHDDNEAAESMAIDYNGTASTNPNYGKIVVVGHVSSNEETETDEGDGDPNAAYKTFVARFLTNGKLDKNFNNVGYLYYKAGLNIPSVDARAVAIESNDSIVIAGSEGKNLGSNDHHFFLARLTAAGAIDKTFGLNGVITTNIGTNDIATSLVIGGFGQQLIAGGVTNSGFALAAYSLDGHLDTAFNGTGKEITSFGGQSHITLALGPNHTIVAAGGSNFDTARYFDISPNATVTSLDPTAGPTTTQRIGKLLRLIPNPASLTVSIDEKVSVSTRVFFTIGGTALPPTAVNVKTKRNNYTLSGMTLTTIAGKNEAYVDIPAGQTSTTVAFTPNVIPANTTTATFSIVPSVNYQTASPASQTITLLGTNPTTPVATTLTTTADTYIQDGSTADTNFGTATQLLVKKSSTTGQNRETYLKFDLSSLSTVNSVKLNLFGALNNTDSPSLVTQVFSIADNSWLETGITWNKRRTPGATALASATITGTTQKLYTFDVTAYVKAQLAAGIKTVSFVLINSANSDPAVVFNSKEAASNKPTLTIT